MKEFLQILRRFVPPYKKYLMLTVVFNILSAVLNIFSFAAIIPILQIIFKTEKAVVVTRLMEWDWDNLKEVAANNMNYWINWLIGDIGPATTHGYRARHTQPALPEDNLLATRVLLGGAQGRHHREDER